MIGAEVMVMADAAVIASTTLRSAVAKNKARPAQFLPTTANMRDFAQAVCMGLLGNPTVDADRVFNAARAHAGSFYLPKGTQLIRSRSFDELCGLDSADSELRVGRPEAVALWLATRHRGKISPLAQAALDMLAGQNRQALVVANAQGELGVIAL